MSTSLNVQSILDEIQRVVDRYRTHPAEKVVLEEDLRKVAISIKGDIDERQDELYKALENAADELLLSDEPDFPLTLAEINAEKRRSAERKQATN